MPYSSLVQSEKGVRPDDPAFLLFTSGSTGLPKAVMDSHYSRVNNSIQHALVQGYTEQDRICLALPLFHCFSLATNVFAACAAGSCLYLPDSRRTTGLLKAISVGKCTVLNGVPTLYHALLHSPSFPSADLSSLRMGIVGGSACSKEQFCEFEHRFGFTLMSSLGQTEATGGLTMPDPSDPLEVRAATVGKFMPYLEGSIRHPQTGLCLPTGEEGEICIRGYSLMQGYYKQPKETAKAIDGDGWLHTGDLGYLDEQGNLHLTGRIKELIIRGGENISPTEIEALLVDDHRIELCKAVGVPDPHYGEEACLCIVPKDGAQLSEKDLRTYLRSHLAAYKVPRYILFFSSLPTTATGKIRGREVAALAKAQLKL